MKNLVNVLPLILILVACNQPVDSKSELNKAPLTATKIIVQNKSPQINLIEKQWNFMVFEKGGCLGGEQYVTDKDFKPEQKPLVFSDLEWKTFSKNDKTELTEFLITKLSDTTKTQIHTCPFFRATNGEMAVYSLQHIHDINWLDFAEFKDYKNREYKSATDQPQMWLLDLLKNKTKRNILATLFRNELKK